MQKYQSIAFALSALLCSSMVSADVTITSRTSVRMVSATLSNLTTTEMYQGDRRRATSEELKGLDALFWSGEQSESRISIVSSDAGVEWILYSKDLTYTEDLFLDTTGSITSQGDQQQSIDSAFQPSPVSVSWRIAEFTRALDTLLNIPCSVFASMATATLNNEDSSMAVYCRLWMADQAAYNAEAVNYMRCFDQITGIGDDQWRAMYNAILSQFGVTLNALGLDSIPGIPLLVDISVSVLVSPDGYRKFVADSGAIARAVLDEATQSGPDWDMNGSSAVDSADSVINKTRRELEQAIKEGIVPGWVELFGIRAEITSIDTTAQPDSLFEIPAGYTRR